MDPAHWLALGLGSSLVLLGTGFLVGRATLLDDLRYLEGRLAARMAQVEELLKQGEAGAKAMGLMVQVERTLAAKRGRALWGLLPRADHPSTPAPSGEAPSGAEGKTGNLVVGGGDGPPAPERP